MCSDSFKMHKKCNYTFFQMSYRTCGKLQAELLMAFFNYGFLIATLPQTLDLGSEYTLLALG